MSTWIKIILGAAAVIVAFGLALFVWELAAAWALSGGADASSKAELVQNYRAHQPQLQQLKTYFNDVVPPAYQVYIEYEDDDKVDLWVYKRTGPGEQDLSVVFQQWSIDPYRYEPSGASPLPHPNASPATLDLAAVKQQLGWTDATFREIKRQLDAANCISVQSGEPTQIGFARSGLGKYSYNLFSQPLPDSVWQSTRWNNGCSLEPLNRRVVLEYGGGAMGPDCFPVAN